MEFMLKYEGGEIRCRRILLAETGGLFEISKDASVRPRELVSLLADRGKYRSVPDKSFSLEKLAQDSSRSHR